MVWFVYCISLFVFLLLAFMLIKQSEISANGVKRGLEMCVNKLIPAMYPFLFLSVFFVSSGIAEKCVKLIPNFFQRLLALPKVSFIIILMSILGGYPVGAKMTDKMLQKNKITKQQAQRLLLFCVNPGPSFVINAVGLYMLNSKQAGLIIFLSLVLATFTVMFFSRYIFDYSSELKTTDEELKNIGLWETAVSAVKESTEAMISVCSWVILFSCITDMLQSLPVSEGIKLFVTSVSEVTNGCQNAVNYLPIPIIAGIIGFGGFCVHMQIMHTVIRTGMSVKLFVASRIIHASLAVMYCIALLKVFPVSAHTVSLGSLPARVNSDVSAPVSIGVILMCVLLLIGENYNFKKTRNKPENKI